MFKVLLISLLFIGFAWADTPAPVTPPPVIQQVVPVPSKVEMYYFYRPGCKYCIAWERDIGWKYHTSPEAQRAPMKAFDVLRDPPEKFGISLETHITPTFVIMKDGKKVAALYGYNFDSELFWLNIDKLIDEAYKEEKEKQ